MKKHEYDIRPLLRSMTIDELATQHERLAAKLRDEPDNTSISALQLVIALEVANRVSEGKD